MIVVTGASGQLGRHVVSQLLEKVPASELVFTTRSPDKVKDLSARGVQVRQASFSEPDSLVEAFAGAQKLLLISSSELGQRAAQHTAAAQAAKQAGVKQIIYTSILHADRSPIGLAGEHIASERAIAATGIPYVFLRNGWYFENYTEHFAPAIEHGAIFGCARNGRISAAARADYAAAAVAVLTTQGHDNKIYELAGDGSFTMSELAAEASRQLGKPVEYKDLSQADYRAALLNVLPAPVADMLSDADAGIAKGALDENGRQLSKLIGRPTQTLAQAVAQGLSKR